MSDLPKGATEVIRSLIEERGPIPYSTFVETALYHPICGYYSHVAVGRDFETSPRTSPAFGHLLGQFVADCWRALNCPRPFVVAEYGAGDGSLAFGITGWLAARDPTCAAAMRYVACDRSAVIVPHERVFAVRGDASDPPTVQFDGLILSHELFDAVPFDRYLAATDGFREMLVSFESGRFLARAGDLVPNLQRHVEALGVQPAIGQYFDVSRGAMMLCQSLVASIRRGFMLTIDYGAEAKQLYGPTHFAGSALGHFRHSVVDDVLARPGEQDITSHVDFTSLQHAGEQAGMATIWSGSQADFLRAQGLRDWLERLDPRYLGSADLHNARFRAMELVSGQGVGRFRVLVQARGSPGHLDRLV